jgi:hypothetical protein
MAAMGLAHAFNAVGENWFLCRVGHIDDARTLPQLDQLVRVRVTQRADAIIGGAASGAGALARRSRAPLPLAVDLAANVNGVNQVHWPSTRLVRIGFPVGSATLRLPYGLLFSSNRARCGIISPRAARTSSTTRKRSGLLVCERNSGEISPIHQIANPGGEHQLVACALDAVLVLAVARGRKLPHHIVDLGTKLVAVSASFRYAHGRGRCVAAGRAEPLMMDQPGAAIAKDGDHDGRPMVLFSLADCDPAGHQMPVSIGRKLHPFAT